MGAIMSLRPLSLGVVDCSTRKASCCDHTYGCIGLDYS